MMHTLCLFTLWALWFKGLPYTFYHFLALKVAYVFNLSSRCYYKYTLSNKALDT